MSAQLIYYVYAYLRQDGTPYYIGKGKSDRAFNKGPGEIKLPKDPSRIIFLEKNLSEIGALAIERRMIRWYGRKDLGTGILRNMTDGGDGVSGLKMSQKSKQIMSEIKKGKPSGRKGCSLSEEHRKKLSEAKKGKKRSQESIDKQRQSSIGRICSEETKKKISQKNTGHLVSEETRKKISEKCTGNYHTEETKKRIRETTKNRKWWNNGVENKFCGTCPGEGWVEGKL